MLPSASNWPRIMSCSPSGAPGLVSIKRDGARGKRGTAIHKFLEDSLLGHGTPACDLDEGEMAKLRGVDLRSMLPKMLGEGHGKPEVAVALHTKSPTSSKLLEGSNGHRDYSGCDDESIPGTVDLIWETDDSVIICDYKTSLNKTAAELLDDHRWQLVILALGHLHATKHNKAIKLAIIHIDETFTFRKAIRDFDVFEQDSTYDEICAKASTLGAGDHRPGSYCTYCPKYDTCPATTGLLSALVQGDSALPADWGQAVEKVRQLKILVAALDERLKDHARAVGGIPTANGKVYGPVEQTRTSIDPYHKEIRAILKEYGAEKAIMLEQKVTQDSLREALSGDRGKVREVMGRLREAGVLVEKTFEVMKEYKP